MNARAERREQHWRRYAISTARNPAQSLRRRLIRRMIVGVAKIPGARIIDIGCGSGDLLQELRGIFPDAEFAGVDIAESGLAVSETKVPDVGFHVFDLNGDAPPPPAVENWADCAVCSEVLEHVDDPVKALGKIAICMKPGGRLAVTVPGGPMSAFDHHIGHHHHFTPDQLRELLEQAGFQVKSIAAAGFPTFNLYRLVVIARGRKLIDDVDGAPGWLARTAMGVFDVLLHFSLPHSPWGWQITAVADKPEDA